MTDNQPNAAATRDKALAYVFNEDVIDVPEWGGTVHLTGVPINHPRITKYMDQVSPQATAERSARRQVALVVMGCYTADGDQLFRWSDVDGLRSETLFAPVGRVALRILELSQGESVADMGKSSAATATSESG